MVGLDAVLEISEIISVNCPLNEKTRHLLGRREFGLMKKSAFIINTARGSIIDEKALIEALSEDMIAGAGMDVLEQEPPLPDNPLLRMDNVIITPHMSWYSCEAERDLVAGAFEHVRRMILNLMRG